MDDPREKLSAVMKDLEDQARKLGLYIEHAAIASSDPEGAMESLEDADKLRELLASDEDEVYLMATFAIGDVAWSKRVQDPEQDKIDDQFRVIAPDPVEELREKMRRAAAEGKSILDIDLEGGDDDGSG